MAKNDRLNIKRKSMATLQRTLFGWSGFRVDSMVHNAQNSQHLRWCFIGIHFKRSSNQYLRFDVHGYYHAHPASVSRYLYTKYFSIIFWLSFNFRCFLLKKKCWEFLWTIRVGSRGESLRRHCVTKWDRSYYATIRRRKYDAVWCAFN